MDKLISTMELHNLANFSLNDDFITELGEKVKQNLTDIQ